jgi:RES domain-containing protein
VILLPPPFGTGAFVAWRLDAEKHAATWDSGEGAFRVGGRWNSPGVRAVYMSLDPATAILEVAVHKGFPTLDIVPHTLTSAAILDTGTIHIVMPDDVPNANWLRPCPPSLGQQQFGDALLAKHAFVLIPSAVATYSWNLLFVADQANAKAKALYKERSQERFALDTRLHKAP